jgi:hypothetical protein
MGAHGSTGTGITNLSNTPKFAKKQLLLDINVCEAGHTFFRLRNLFHKQGGDYLLSVKFLDT